MSRRKNTPLTEAQYYILISLYSPLHGYGIMKNISKISKGRIKISAGTLYGALNILLLKGWIKEYKNTEHLKKEYIITELGKCIINDEIERLKELLDNGNNIIKRNL